MQQDPGQALLFTSLELEAMEAALDAAIRQDLISDEYIQSAHNAKRKIHAERTGTKRPPEGGES